MKFCLYTSEQEENIFARKKAKTWQHSGLISEDQLHIIESNTDPEVKQTNLFFRILFFIFTSLTAGAIVVLTIWLGPNRSDGWVPPVLIIFGIGFYFLAQHFVKKYSLYRHGVEEALALIAILLFCIGCWWQFNQFHFDNQSTWIIVCSFAAITALWIHWRFGFLHALLISIAALCVIPYQLSLSAATERSLLLLVLCLVIFISIMKDKSEIADFQKERNTIVQACLLGAIYLIVNLRLPELIIVYIKHGGRILQQYAGFEPYIYWTSYVLTFFIPIAGIYSGLKSRKRLIINVSLVSACLTLATNKDYLGLKHYAWDPAIMGILLIALSIILKKWLTNGISKTRYGFTAENILQPENYGISLTDIGAALTPSFIDSQQPTTPTEKYFAGGRSGGGGTTGDF
jgi:hypothetical protein